jgi:hypothetical protein
MKPADSPRPLRLTVLAAVAPGDRNPRHASETDAIVQARSEVTGRRTRNVAKPKRAATAVE